MQNYFFILIFLLLFSCQKNERAEGFGALTVAAGRPATLLETPGKKGKPLLELSAGARVFDLDETSDFLTPVKIGDSLFASPWLRVKTTDGQAGWVYAASVAPEGVDFGEWFRRKKTDCFFGKKISRQLTGWGNAMENTFDDRDFAENYREGVRLRDTIVAILERRSEPNDADFQPDFFWLNAVMPGFVVQMVAEGTRPWLFADFRFFQKMAAQTPENQDDKFIAACIAAFPADSVESFFPGWRIQTSDYEGSSQLGDSSHLRVLRAIDAALQAGAFFEPELLALKDRLLADVLDKNTTFWQPKDLIVKELTEILNLKYACLTDRDRLALTERLRILKDAEANGVRVNLRAG